MLTLAADMAQQPEGYYFRTTRHLTANPQYAINLILFFMLIASVSCLIVGAGNESDRISASHHALVDNPAYWTGSKNCYRNSNACYKDRKSPLCDKNLLKLCESLVNNFCLKDKPPIIMPEDTANCLVTTEIYDNAVSDHKKFNTGIIIGFIVLALNVIQAILHFFNSKTNYKAGPYQSSLAADCLTVDHTKRLAKIKALYRNEFNSGKLRTISDISTKLEEIFYKNPVNPSEILIACQKLLDLLDTFKTEKSNKLFQLNKSGLTQFKISENINQFFNSYRDYQNHPVQDNPFEVAIDIEDDNETGFLLKK